MAAGCCKARARALRSSTSICDEFEKEGAGVRVFPVSTNSGMLLMINMPEGGPLKKVELFEYVSQMRCNGATARWLLRQKSNIASALVNRPTIFVPYLQSGLTLGSLGTLVRNR